MLARCPQTYSRRLTLQIPGNMTAPRPKLLDGEEILYSAQGMRKKGWFGNLFGELHLTNQRLIFVKAIMKSGLISATVNKVGAKPKVAIDRTSLQLGKEPWKKMVALTASDSAQAERFILEEAQVDGMLEASQS